MQMSNEKLYFGSKFTPVIKLFLIWNSSLSGKIFLLIPFTIFMSESCSNSKIEFDPFSNDA